MVFQFCNLVVCRGTTQVASRNILTIFGSILVQTRITSLWSQREQQPLWKSVDQFLTINSKYFSMIGGFLYNFCRLPWPITTLNGLKKLFRYIYVDHNVSRTSRTTETRWKFFLQCWIQAWVILLWFNLELNHGVCR